LIIMNLNKKNIYIGLGIIVVIAALILVWLFQLAGLSRIIKTSSPKGGENKPLVSPPPTITEEKEETVVLKSIPVLGEKTAPITLIEFASFDCLYCAHFQQQIFPQLKENYINSGKVKFVFYQFPGQDPRLNLESQATFCAKEKNKYWEYIDTLFYQSVPSDLTEELQIIQALNNLGFSAGVDDGSIMSCLFSRKYADLVSEQNSLAEKLKIENLPTFLIGSQRIVGIRTYQELAKFLDEELAKIK